MAPSNLQGLNIVHPIQSHADSQDLLSGPPFPDLSAQLDLWTNLAFDSDDTSLEIRGEDEEEERPATGTTGEAAIRDGHTNVVIGKNLGNNQSSEGAAPSLNQAFDMNSFLAGFGIDPFSVPPLQASSPAATVAPSLAQLLALHSVQNPFPAASVSSSTPVGQQSLSHSSTTSDDPYPASKRARTRKPSVSTAASSPETYRDETPAPSGTPMSAAEDKRRRNTAASARFRLKKKEREAALEGKAKELESRVNELERECEGLRRENGWLKGLVVGVTGAAQGPAVTAPQKSTTGNKRSRDEQSR
ncbi:hypothetical protein BD779DRAFT_1506380 [Infundibulicybe gibba]|nr:hypothetical protein BD779DRAFT_1506380 [Infundibulicybe gibba]